MDAEVGSASEASCFGRPKRSAGQVVVTSVDSDSAWRRWGVVRQLDDSHLRSNWLISGGAMPLPGDAISSQRSSSPLSNVPILTAASRQLTHFRAGCARNRFLLLFCRRNANLTVSNSQNISQRVPKMGYWQERVQLPCLEARSTRRNSQAAVLKTSHRLLPPCRFCLICTR